MWTGVTKGLIEIKFSRSLNSQGNMKTINLGLKSIAKAQRPLNIKCGQNKTLWCGSYT